MKATAVLTGHRRTTFAVAVAVAAGGAVAVAALWWHHGDSNRSPLVPALDYSGRTRLCLAFDDDASSRSTAETARSIVRAATADRTANLQELTVPAGAPEEAASYLAGLAAQRCNLIITVGPASATGVPALSTADPTLRFAVLGSPTSVPGPTVVIVDQQDMTRALTSQVTAITASAPTR
ncbi:hypothetical protein [Kitasatospora sp. NPDC057223]|uniref:hypothetical protein n=1 Tax=Kitasatospora sp. NPDC057223 TaxID=3346055 RepID=UPI00362827AD